MGLWFMGTVRHGTKLSFYPIPMQFPGRHTPPPPNFLKDVEEAPLSRGEFQKELKTGC
jgi:hypothetical protein